jgi:signal transduction histidine kinase
LIAVSLGVGLAVYPVIRRITSRLEGLQQSVEALGEGKLGARVQVSGTDEVAALAESFNRAASRIEALVAGQKRLLAYASHELRSPLARIQMALSLVGTQKDEEARGEINTSIRELDKLIGEILLSSRFEAENFQAVIGRLPIDLTGLAAEESARAGVEIHGEHLHVLGDITLLRRLIRNLVENAQRYAGGTEIAVRVERYDSDQAMIAVSDGGPGVPADQRQRVFEPFYRMPGSSEKDGGVGLGLALVRSIAAQHSGKAFYAERDGGGACFCVVLPLAKAS